jgi:D-3-phosphoglycerate dehydrogenase
VRVLITESLDPRAAERLREAGHEPVVQLGLQGAELIEALRGASALIVRGATKVTAEVIAGASNLKVIARAGTGLDNIAVAAARERNIAVVNAPAANAVAVAELVFALLLALERHVIAATSELRAGRWERQRFMGRELMGRRLGLVGFGRIAREVAVRARAFGMTVAASDPLLTAWPAGFDWVETLSFERVLEDSDIVSVHVPLDDSTRGMIGAREFALMKPGAIFVNVARGGIADEAALHAALASGMLQGAALDVFSTEPPGQHPLLHLPNVLATPHLGASTHEAQERAGVEAAERVIEALGTLSSV